MKRVLSLRFLMVLLALQILILSIVTCRHKEVIPASPEISFKNDVQPIIVGSCAINGCHSNSSYQRSLITYNDVLTYVTPGNANRSNLYSSIVNLGWNQMPPDHPLSEEQIKLIYVWIMQGAKNN